MMKEQVNIYQAACAITRYLATSIGSKGHGEYRHYKDEKVWVTLDTYNGSVTVYVAGERVYWHSGDPRTGTLECFSGPWSDYVLSLYPKAIEAEESRKRKVEEEDRRKRDAEATKKKAAIESIFGKY